MLASCFRPPPANSPIKNHLTLDDKSLRIVLPGYRGPYAPNDFINMEVRSVDKAVAGYLARHVNRAPWIKVREIVFQIATTEQDTKKESITIAAYRDLFRDQAQTHWRHFTDQIPLTVALASLGVFILWLSKSISDSHLEENIRHTLADTIQVGAWVALWTAIAGIFSVGFLSLQKYFAFRRLARTRMSFVYSSQGTLVDEC
jgi:hypothetical protein